MPTCVLVLGVPRSGTSCMAGILSRLEVNMGSRFCNVPLEWNALGSYMDADFDEMIAKSNDLPLADWPEEIPSHVIDSIRDWAMVRSGLWGVKHHMLPYALRSFDSLENIFVIKMKRPLEDSLASWKARVTLNEIPDSERRYSVLNRLIQTWISNCGRPILEVDYYELIDDPNTGVNRVAEFIGVPSTNVAKDFVIPELRRF